MNCGGVLCLTSWSDTRSGVPWCSRRFWSRVGGKWLRTQLRLLTSLWWANQSPEAPGAAAGWEDRVGGGRRGSPSTRPSAPTSFTICFLILGWPPASPATSRITCIFRTTFPIARPLGCLPPRGQTENKIRGVHIPPSHDPSK